MEVVEVKMRKKRRDFIGLNRGGEVGEIERRSHQYDIRNETTVEF